VNNINKDTEHVLIITVLLWPICQRS